MYHSELVPQKPFSTEFLSADREFELVQKVQKTKCRDSMGVIIMSHLKFVKKIVKKYSGYGFDSRDLEQEGVIGFLKAVNRFDLSLGLRLNTFALYYVRGEIMNYVINNYKGTRIATTKDHHKLFFNLNSQKVKDEPISLSEAKRISNALDLNSVNSVFEMEKRMSSVETSFHYSDGFDFSLEDKIYNECHNVESQFILEDFHGKQVANMYQSFDKLTPNEKTVIERRWLTDDKSTLKELANELGISAERIRQIELKAFSKIHDNVVSH